MTEETVRLTKEENHRAVVLDKARCSGRTNKQVAQALGLSVRQVQRLKKALREEGPVGLAHGNRDRDPSNILPEVMTELIVALYSTKYEGFNFTHFHEKLLEVEGIEVSVRSVRRMLAKAGYTSPKKRRPPKHRSRRERLPCEGAMLQIDGSPHDWLEGRGPRMCLLGAIDDATGKVAGALFRDREDAHGYFLMMREVVTKRGIPETVYRDRHGIFERDAREKETLWEQMEGRRSPTQFGRLMEELGVRQIPANSPQAKGRVERLWGTFQDRLVSELRLAGVCTMDEANEALRRMVADHNRRFARTPNDPKAVYRPVGKSLNLDGTFCFKYRRVVANDNTVAFFGRVIQIGGPRGRSYAKRSVEVQERFDGSLHVYHQEECIAKTAPAAVVPEVIRVRHGNGRFIEECPWPVPKNKASAGSNHPPDTEAKKTKEPSKPAANHPWRRHWVTKSLADKG